MHFIGIGAGSTGDVLPCLLTAQALKARGHEVQFITAPNFRAMVEEGGIDFIAGGSERTFDEVIGDPEVWHPRRAMQALWRHIGPLWAQGYEVLAKAVRPRHTVVFGGGLALQMRLVQEKLGIGVVTIHLAPAGLLSAHDPPLMPSLGWLGMLPPRIAGVVLSLVEKRVVDPMIVPELNRFRASIGLEPVAGVARRWMNSPDRVVCAFPAWFAAPQPDWPPNAVCTTFPLVTMTRGQGLPEPLRAFLDAGEPPLLFTPGSGMAHGRAFFERAVASASTLGMRAVLVTGYPDQLPTRLPASVIHSPYVPFERLVPRVAMVIHHGGIGTVARGLAAGKPQLLTPFAYDQPDNARRLKRLGVADSIGPASPASRWTKAIAGLLANDPIERRCKELASRLAQEGSGAERTADEIVAVARRRDAEGA